MGSDEFLRLIFDKVFTNDINRLRSMEDMWKTRTPPVALKFDDILGEAAGVDSSTAQQDQKAWTLSENVAVFIDRYAKRSG